MRTVIKMFFYQLYFYYKKQLSIFLINSHLNELYLSTFIRFYNYFLFVLVLLLSLLLRGVIFEYAFPNHRSYKY